MRVLNNLAYYIIFYLWSVLFFLFFSPVKFFTRNFAVFLSKIWTSSIMALSKKILGIDCIIHGEKNFKQLKNFNFLKISSMQKHAVKGLEWFATHFPFNTALAQ